MNKFTYQGDNLCAEEVLIIDLAQIYKTPFYLYSQTAIERNYAKFEQSFLHNQHLICYSVKVNSNLAILNTLVKLGAGFDVVSIGELKRVIKSGGKVNKCVFSGVAKQKKEIEFALKKGIYCLNVESKEELNLIIKVATKLNIIAPISIRVNPNVDAKTHPYIATGLSENKFGVDILEALDLYIFASNNSQLKILGIDCHIGSQITQVQPFLDTLDKILALVKTLKNHHIQIFHLDLGGGVGIDYNNNQTIDIKSYISEIEQKTNLKIILEPGRAIVGNAGVFITKVEFLKQNKTKSFAIVDGGMNDLLRPALYQAYHNILPVIKRKNGLLSNFDVVGPVCETGDYLGKNRKLNLKRHDLLAVMSAGAYSFVMASNYNSRTLVAEVMVKNKQHKLIRKRQIIEELFKDEEISGIN